MSMHSKPNSFVSQPRATTTQLTYALQVDPAPLTVSVPDEDPMLGSLELVVTNPTASAISVTSVSFTFQVGTSSDDLTTTTANVGTTVSDRTDWIVTGPISPVTSGSAIYTLGPATGSSVTLAAGASVVVQIFGFPTIESPGNTTIEVKEMIEGMPAFTSFQVTTFPTGFYFNGLIAAAQDGSQLVPVAQVAANAAVTLMWLSSVADLGAFTIYYSNAGQGQQSASPTDIGEWTSPPLTSDTVFTVVVTVSVAGGQPLTAALSTAVSVQDPTLIAASITARQATVTGAASVSGALTANAVTATGLTVDGAATIGDLTANRTVTAPGQSNLGNVSVGGALSVGGQTTLAGVTAQSVVAGIVSGTDGIGGNAASIQGYGTGGAAGVFAFKFDQATFGPTSGAIQIWCSSSGVYKTFIVDHPCEPERFLVHATLEGPEGAVYYRGTARLSAGRAEIVLPAYFERFTRREGRTVLLTNIDGFDLIAVRTVDGEKIKNGILIVESSNPHSTQAFDWEVKAVRADGPSLCAEPLRAEIEVAGFGPYTYQVRRPERTRP